LSHREPEERGQPQRRGACGHGQVDRGDVGEPALHGGDFRGCGTCTTLLQKLLSADPAARPLPLWEGLFPFMVPNQHPDRRSVEARKAAAIQHVRLTSLTSSRLAVIHDLDPMGAEECYWLLMNSLADYFFLLLWRVPAFREMLDAMTESEWTGVCREYLALLRILDGGMSDRHWVFKYPFHARRMATIARLVPNAIFVQTYRDFSVSFMQTFRKNPGRVVKRVERILSAWQSQAPEDSFYGMSLKEFEDVVRSAKELRERLEALKRETLVLIQSRALIDKKCHALANGVVFGVRAHCQQGPESPLYCAMGYVPESKKRLVYSNI